MPTSLMTNQVGNKIVLEDHVLYYDPGFFHKN